jgi:ABC-type dipeptide/oligopeptide/nickel transport system ATPase component
MTSCNALIKNHICFLVGPEGVGKSVTVSTFMSFLNDKNWKITWLNLIPGSDDVKCTVYKPYLMKEFFIKTSNIQELLDDESESTTLRQFLVIDGIENLQEHKLIQGRAIWWKLRNRMRNQLIMICSIAARDDYSQIDEDKHDGMETY